MLRFERQYVDGLFDRVRVVLHNVVFDSFRQFNGALWEDGEAISNI